MTASDRLEFILEGQELEDSRRAIRNLLVSSREFAAGTETGAGFVFTYVPRSSLLMTTEINLDLASLRKDLRVTVKAQPPAWIMGDIFRMYPRMLRRVEAAVRREIEAGHEEETRLPVSSKSNAKDSVGLMGLSAGLIVASFLTSAVVGLSGLVGWIIFSVLLVAGISGLIIRSLNSKSRRGSRDND